MKISGNELKVGMLIEHNGRLWTACKLQHVKPGKGGAFVPETAESSVKGEVFSKEHLKETIAGNCESEIKSNYSYFEVKEETVSEEKTESKGKGSVFDGLKMKLAGSAGFFSGVNTCETVSSNPDSAEKKGFFSRMKAAGHNSHEKDHTGKKGFFSSVKTGKDSRIDEISRRIDEESGSGYKIKEYLAVNSGNIFKVLMCVAVLFLVLALMPAGVAFKPSVSACVGIFLVCVAVAVYARKLGKEHTEERVKGDV